VRCRSTLLDPTDVQGGRFEVHLIPTKGRLPVCPNAKGRDFLDGLSLAPADMPKLMHNNADALLKLKVGAG
jgi:hypothetical protein